MAGWNHLRGAALGATLVAAAWAVVALAAPATQPPDIPNVGPLVPPPPGAKLTFFPDPPPPKPDEPLAAIKMPVEDDKVTPADARQPVPGGVRPVAVPPLRAGDVPDPPHPVVVLRVRVPADAAPGDDVKYIISVQNVSAADAHAVTVRNPLAAEVEAVVKAEPEADKALSEPGKQLVWSLGTLKAGASRTIELTLRPKPGTSELKNLAYVKYEYGQVVKTKIAGPTVKVTKNAPKQTVRDEPYTVRVLLENTGRVPAENVRVVENVPASAQVEAITAGGTRTAQPEGQQWVWEVKQLRPGERKVIEYRITPRETKDVITLTSVSGAKLAAEKPTEGRTQVLVPGLELKLTGPQGVVNAGEKAEYEIVVRNTGTLPSTNVRVVGTLPADAKPVMKTDGGVLGRDTITWTLSRLEPGEARSFRFAVKATTTGRRVVTAAVADARGQRQTQEVATVFAGAPALSWQSTFDPLTIQVGKQGTFTVKVKNTGGEAARDVRVQIQVPNAVTVVQTTPAARTANGTVTFPVEPLSAGAEAVYTLTIQGRKPEQAWFKVTLTADCLGDRPMETEKAVNVIGNPK